MGAALGSCVLCWALLAFRVLGLGSVCCLFSVVWSKLQASCCAASALVPLLSGLPFLPLYLVIPESSSFPFYLLPKRTYVVSRVCAPSSCVVLHIQQRARSM
jgi:hypothetical protein